MVDVGVHHFRDRVDLPKKSVNWGLAKINETELPAELITTKPTGSRAKKKRQLGFVVFKK